MIYISSAVQVSFHTCLTLHVWINTRHAVCRNPPFSSINFFFFLPKRAYFSQTDKQALFDQFKLGLNYGRGTFTNIVKSSYISV